MFIFSLLVTLIVNWDDCLSYVIVPIKKPANHPCCIDYLSGIIISHSTASPHKDHIIFLVEQHDQCGVYNH